MPHAVEKGLGGSADVIDDVARFGEVLAVVAHPGDESFGLGAVLTALDANGATTRVLCFTQGEASTLGTSAELGLVRHRELPAAAQVLGVTPVRLADYPDGGLDDGRFLQGFVMNRLAGMGYPVWLTSACRLTSDEGHRQASRSGRWAAKVPRASMSRTAGRGFRRGLRASRGSSRAG